jgi:hypothetical protein
MKPVPNTNYSPVQERFGRGFVSIAPTWLDRIVHFEMFNESLHIESMVDSDGVLITEISRMAQARPNG